MPEGWEPRGSQTSLLVTCRRCGSVDRTAETRFSIEIFTGPQGRAPSQTRSNRILERFSGYHFLNQRTLEDRPRIKTRVIRAPEAPAVFMLFLNCQVNQ
jgi:hypothetical protein